MRWRSALAVLAGLLFFSQPVPPASAAASFSAYGADGSGTGVHVLGGSNAFPNFRTGALDNAYPLAVAHIDASPAALATASVADTGPLGATAASQANGAQQPQYAIASYPGPDKASLSTGASVAEVAATETSADAVGSVAAAGTGGAGAVEQPDDPGHTSEDRGEAHVVIDKGKGLLSASSLGHADRATFGAGLLVIDSVDVRAAVTTDGTKAEPSSKVAVHGASVNGTPVEITEKGVVVADDPLPGSDAMTQVVNGQLNQALASSGIKVFVAAPNVTVEGGRGLVAASGVHVVVAPPSPDPSVPTVSSEYVLGEARAFAFGIVGEPPGTTPGPGPGEDLVPVGGSGEAASVSGGSVGAELGVVPPPLAAPAGSPAASLRSIADVRPRPTWLVALYLVWQALVLTTTALVLRVRKAMP